jgi:hypothetical protein
MSARRSDGHHVAVITVPNQIDEPAPMVTSPISGVVGQVGVGTTGRKCGTAGRATSPAG